MIESCPSKIEYSAIFEATNVKFFILKTRLGDKSRFYFQVITNKEYWGLKYEPQLTYWGPSIELNNIDLLINLRNISQDSKTYSKFVPEILKTVFYSYGLNLYKKSILTKIGESLKDFFENAKLTHFVDGLTPVKSSNVLTLSSAQDIGRKVRDSESLDNTDLALIKILLTEAPLIFGYWGPFKTLMKYFNPSLMPIEFGKGIGRLAKSRGCKPCDIFSEDSINVNDNLEDITWLKYFIPIPSIDTYNYMSKRMRRIISKLAIHNPKIFPIVSTNILIEWDSKLSAASFIPAYILGGNEQTLDSISRNVKIPFIQDHRIDAHPLLWNKNLDKIQLILERINNSPEIFTFCIHILRENNQAIPHLSERLIRLALQSYDESVVKLIIPYIIANKDIWDLIPSFAWTDLILNNTLIKDLEKILEELDLRDIHLPNLHYSIMEIIVCYQNGNHKSNIDIKRLSKIAQLFLINYSKINNYWDRRFDDYEEILITCIDLAFNHLTFNDSKNKWDSIFNTINLPVIVKSYINLLNSKIIKNENIKIIYTYILNTEIEDDSEIIELLKICFENTEPTLYDIGWHFISSADNQEIYYAESLWDWIKRKKTSTLLHEKWSIHRLQLIVDLLQLKSTDKEQQFKLLTDKSWNFKNNEITWLLTRLPVLRLFAWDQLDQEGLERLKEILLSDSSLISSIGDSLDADKIKTSGPSQQNLLQRYIVLNSNRVKTDRTFAIALAALPNPSLQETVLNQLYNANELEKCWLTLGELGLPLPLATVRKFLESETDKDKFSQNLVACIDSMVEPLRDMGIELLDKQRHRVDQEYIASALVDSDDSKVITKVAEEVIAREWKENSSLASFDKRILITRRTNRKAKELIKERLKVRTELGKNDYLAPERREALIDLANGENLRDKEWALIQIAELTLQGVPFDDIQVSMTTTKRRAN